MAALRLGAVLWLVHCVPFLVLSGTSRDDLQAVLSAVEKLITYYHRNHDYLNLDGLFGLRVIEGQLQLLLSEHQAGRHQHLSQEVINRMIALKSAAQNASKIGLESVRKDDSKYFNEFSSMVLHPWTFMKPHRRLEASLRWEIPQYKAKMKVKLTEEMSDRCMTELLQDSGQGCEISNECIQIMTTRGLTGYGITHQILWSVVGEIMANCSQLLSKKLLQNNMGDISRFQLELCTNNFYEMVAVIQVLMHGKVHESQQDLFLEQQFVCPNLGFYEFLKKDYLDQILSWQFPSGCFGEKDGPKVEEDIDLAALLESYHDKNVNFVPEVRKLDQNNEVKKMVLSNLTTSKADNALKFGSESVVTTTSAKLPGFVQSPRMQVRGQIRQGNVNNNARDGVQEALRGVKRQMKVKEVHPYRLESMSASAAAPKHRVRLPHKFLQRSGAVLKQALNTGSDVHGLNGKRKTGERHLLVEKEMKDGCLSHKTGVGSGALVMYLRYLVDPGSINWTSQHELLQSDFRSLLQAAGEGHTAGSSVGAGADEEDGEEEDEGNVEEDEGTLNDGVNYSEDNDAEAGDDQGDDDYNEEQAANGEDKAGGENRKLRDVDTVIINDAGGKESEIYPNIDKAKRKNPKIAAGDAESVADQEEDHNYYDDEGETERGIIRRRRPQTSRPHPPVKTRRKHSGKLTSEEHLYHQEFELYVPENPNYTIILFVSIAPFFILFFFLYKFIRKRRVHIRYYF